MYTPAQVAPLPEVLLSTVSILHGLGSDLNGIAAVGAPTSTTWPVANRSLYCPLYMDRPGIVTKFWTFNGATAIGNIDIGLYDVNYKRLSSTGAIAQAGTSVIQEFDVTDFAITAGVFFLGLVESNNTSTFFMRTSNVAGYFNAMGITQEVSALPLPATATPATQTTTLIPIAGIAFRTLVA